MNLTEKEITMIKTLNNEYIRNKGIEENTTWEDVEANCPKLSRGVLSSLVKKEIVDYYGNLPENKDCWNPIFRGKNWYEALRQINL